MAETGPGPSDPARFFLPGPVAVHPEVLEAQCRPMIGHRTDEARRLMRAIQPGLRKLFGTERPVFPATSSATGLMEAAVRNGVGRRLLALVNGAFSERFARIARACGKEVERLEVPWGEVHEPATVAERLSSGRYDAVSVVHSETSTGALSPLPALGEVVAGHDDVLLLVDSVSGVGGTEMRADAWNLDFVLTGSQKALGLPPGLSFALASEATLERARNLPRRGLYFDLVAFAEAMARNETPNTPALSLLFALERQLERIDDEGLEARLARHRALSRRCATWVEETRARTGLQLRILVEDPDERSPTVTCLRLPDGISGPEVVGEARRRGFAVGPGYGPMRERGLRIGHMGDRTLGELDRLLAVLDEVLTVES